MNVSSLIRFRLLIAFLLVVLPVFLHAEEVLHVVAKDNLGKDNSRVVQSAGSWNSSVDAVPLAVCPKDDPARDMVFSGTQLKIRYEGLLKDARYFVRLTCLSDSGDRMQRVYIDGKLVRERFILPSKKIHQMLVQVTREAAEDGEIEIAVEKVTGSNAILSVVELLSDHDRLQADLQVDYYGFRGAITGMARDLNAPDKDLPEGLNVIAEARGVKVSTEVAADGTFSLELPESWMESKDTGISLSCSGVNQRVALVAGDLLGEHYRKVVLDESCFDPFELAVAGDGRVFYIERRGKVKMCPPGARTSQTIAEIEVYTKLDDGLLGLALDPRFMENHWMYLCYSHTGSSENVVSRFTLEGDQLDLSSEKILLRIPVQRDTPPCHTGGSLAFDGKGNLFISTGDNINPFESQGYSPSDTRSGREVWDAQGSSADTNDLRGKVLRITPREDGTYAIPEGNLFVPGTRGTKPEIYVMGCRNPFRIAADQRTGTLYWGEVGPDAGSSNDKRGPAGHDEFNQAKVAGNYGWPHFVGDNKAYCEYDFATGESANKWSAQSPANRSPHNKGLKKLPPAQSALIWYPGAASSKFPMLGSGGRCAMGGPVYYDDVYGDSPRKLGQKYDRSVFFYDWMRGWIMSVRLDEDEKVVGMERFMAEETFRRPMDLELGPDGALYLLEWGSNYGGSNPGAQLVRLEPGVHINALSRDGGGDSDEERERKLQAKFGDSLQGGDAARGKELFKSAKGGCVYCHRSDEPGGVIGPPLAGIGSRMNRRELLDSVIFPSKEVAPSYLTLTVRMKDGNTHFGTVSQEDGRVMKLDTSESGTVTLEKDKIEEIIKGISLMPAGAGEALSPGEMKDLIEYLVSLKAK